MINPIPVIVMADKIRKGSASRTATSVDAMDDRLIPPHCDPCHGNCAACERAEREFRPLPGAGIVIAVAITCVAVAAALVLHGLMRWLA